MITSTYLGGEDLDALFDVANDDGNTYVTGITTSTRFPTLNALQRTLGGKQDGIVAKLNTFGSSNSLTYSTYLGGQGDDAPVSLQIDSSRAVYVSGHTDSADFPTRSAFQATLGGGEDAFVTKLNAAGSALVSRPIWVGAGMTIVRQ